ncbi:MAG: GGDEF domain-containing protein, partial [Proteobacteria bacterium]
MLMWKQKLAEQRAPTENTVSRQRGLAFRIRRSHAWAITLAGLVATATLDYATGNTLWVGPGYLLFLALAAWVLGWREALALMVWAVICTAVLNAQSLYPYQSAATIADYALRIPTVVAMILLLSLARRSCEREWRTARMDTLTGALNRKAFFELAGSIDNSKGWHMLAYADLDGLKTLNDFHGHARGDQALRTFATQVKKAIRRDDLFARIGGDEFLVYMQVRDEQAGLTVAHRLHRAMNTATTDFEEDLECSVGVLILAPGPRSIDRELRAADELMYEAKQNGAALAVASANFRGAGVGRPDGFYILLDAIECGFFRHVCSRATTGHDGLL